eukprot:5123314-Alexandrium_andersonii.AAC.1
MTGCKTNTHTHHSYTSEEAGLQTFAHLCAELSRTCAGQFRPCDTCSRHGLFGHPLRAPSAHRNTPDSVAMRVQ